MKTTFERTVTDFVMLRAALLDSPQEEVGQVARLDFILEVGGLTERVEVTATTTLAQSETTDVGQVIDGKSVVEMPLNGRNYLELARFTVGVLPAGTYGGGQRQAGEGQFIAAGMHGYQNSVLRTTAVRRRTWKCSAT